MLSGDNVTSRGNARQYALRRLYKKRPDLYKRVVLKEMSAHRAMIEAGFKKKPTIVEQLLKLWDKASSKDRAIFLKNI